jgi:co-chaperonin GroES (HSP10)
MMTQSLNNSGIFPSGDRVVVLPDEIKETTEESAIYIPDSVREKHMHAQSTGVLIAVGPDAWFHSVEVVERLIDGQWKVTERRSKGYSEPFAKIGDRVAFAKYGGLQVEGEDGINYRILNDEDITAKVSEGVSFTELKSRKAVGELKSYPSGR